MAAVVVLRAVLSVVTTCERVARAGFVVEKQRKRVSGGEHLCVITGVFQLATAFFERAADLGRALGRGGIQWRSELLQFTIKRIEEDQTVGAEEPRHHRGKRVGE